ncbi:UV-damaged DNA-binding protein RAD7 PWA37_003003 [Arxiozyma heterogenica]|uniref:F-box/LRR-repeat protein 15-like leucin rich repeat domain-containing protein n=1 Tax=Arxiozyma heterogenica TaxID=278026 RepID=A0AAN7VZK0_9SACH|nr:hypothetical protein RI543_004802 [Kazachstania heterogenica]
MYRSRRRNRTSGIKGPNSALTQFLQEEGISAEAIKQRWKDRFHRKESQEPQLDNSVDDETLIKRTKSDDEIEDSSDGHSASSSDEEETETDKDLVNQTKINKFNEDSDEEEYDEESSKIQVLSKSADNLQDRDLKKIKNRQILENRRKRKKRAEVLLDRKAETLPSLQELCVNKITENIVTWEKNSSETSNNPLFTQLRENLGGISNENLDSLAKALSKNRALDDTTLQLFLKTDLKSLTFHDCSKISYEGYKILAIFSPHLEYLTLNMCGQLNNEALIYLAEKLTKLKSLKLDGPFLINEKTWDKFFEIMASRLKEFHISNTHRITDKNLITLLTTSQTVLESLGLSRLDSISNYAIIPQYLQCSSFHTLQIQYPYNEEDVSDEVIINILGQVGSSLKHLSLDGCLELTDSFVINGMGAFLSGNNNVNTLLETLSLAELDQLSTDSLVYFLSQISLPSLKSFSIRRCIQLQDPVIQELLLNSAKNSLITLDLNSVKLLTDQAFALMECPKLQYIDLGFVRCVSDQVIELLGKQNPQLKLLEVFGDNKITNRVRVRQGLTLIGLQGDAI